MKYTYICITMLLSLSALFATPVPSDIYDGVVTHSGKVTTVTKTTSRTVAMYDWKTFDVKADETVNFIANSPSDILYNSILTTAKTFIDGKITSNAQVWIASAGGIVVGKTGSINTQSLVITANQGMNSMTKKGSANVEFTHMTDGSVVNKGTIISDGYVVLQSRHARNIGSIKSGDKVILTNASYLKYHFNGNKMIDYTVRQDDNVLTSIINKGDIKGKTVALLQSPKFVISTGDLLKSTINNTGIIEATSVSALKPTVLINGTGKTTLNGTLKGKDVQVNTNTVAVDSTITADKIGIKATRLDIDDSFANTLNDSLVNTKLAELTSTGVINVNSDLKFKNPLKFKTKNVNINAKINKEVGSLDMFDNKVTKLAFDDAHKGQIILNNQKQLEQVSEYLGANYTLGQDISTTGEWTPIGDKEHPFTGRFTGDGHKISNIHIDGRVWVGLFGFLDHALVNTTIIDNSSITGRGFTGGLAGYARYSSIWNDTIQNSTVQGIDYAGGLIGDSYHTDFNHDVGINTKVLGRDYLGGLVGNSTGYRMYNSSFDGLVKGNNNVGGLIGSADNAHGVERSYTSGTVQGNNNVGGLIGIEKEPVQFKLKHDYSLANVKGNDNVGAFIGNAESVSIEQSYQYGTVQGTTNVGAFFGKVKEYSVNDSYYNIDNNAKGTDYEDFGRTQKQMGDIKTFKGWDIGYGGSRVESPTYGDKYFWVIAHKKDKKPKILEDVLRIRTPINNGVALEKEEINRFLPAKIINHGMKLPDTK